MKHFNESHGHTKKQPGGKRFATSEYNTWQQMKARCHVVSSSGFHKYGAKGITVCDRWRNSFEDFIADMGRKPSPQHSIDRIDCAGNYSPENCRWATPFEQMNNTTKNFRVEFSGRIQTLAQWSRESGIDAEIISLRIRSGWPVEKALFAVVRTASSGVPGVYFQKDRNRWDVRVMHNKKILAAGRFDNLLDAVAARLGNHIKNMVASA